jgi:hypothetical protein
MCNLLFGIIAFIRGIFKVLFISISCVCWSWWCCYTVQIMITVLKVFARTRTILLYQWCMFNYFFNSPFNFWLWLVVAVALLVLFLYFNFTIFYQWYRHLHQSLFLTSSSWHVEDLHYFCLFKLICWLLWTVELVIL